MGWNLLGVVEPRIGEWRNYSPGTVNYPSPLQKALFRITPGNIGLDLSYWTYALIRFSYLNEDGEQFTRPFRVYPRAEPIIQEVTIPTGVDIAPFLWTPQTRKFLWPRYRGRNPESPWNITVEEYLPTDGQVVDTVEELSDQLTNVERFLY